MEYHRPVDSLRPANRARLLAGLPLLPTLWGVDHPAVSDVPIAQAWRAVRDAAAYGDRGPFEMLPEWQRAVLKPELFPDEWEG